MTAATMKTRPSGPTHRQSCPEQRNPSGTATDRLPALRLSWGGTDETLAATKAANNEALATATTNIAVNGEARKDAIEGQYLQTDANIDQQLNDIEKWKAGQTSQASQGVVKAGSNIAGIL